jgi:repressor LexA
MIVDEENMGIPDDIADMFDIDKLFYLKVRGDSMDKVVPDGSFALICEGCDATDHEVVAVRVDGNDATLKRFYRTPSMIILEPDSNNPAHKAQVYHISDGINIEVLGKLVWYRPPVRKVF